MRFQVVMHCALRAVRMKGGHMLTRGNNRVLLHEDVPVDEEKVKTILIEWGIERSAIRRLLKEHRLPTQNIDDRRTQMNSSLPKHGPGQARAYD
jgi:hypothetical protein